MADPHIISALREKRALVSGLIEKLERKLEQHRADLTHIDVCCGYSSPTATLAKSSPSELMSGGLATFARNELSRLCMDALRAAGGALLTTDEIAGRIIEAKGFDTADASLRGSIRDQALTQLRSFQEEAERWNRLA